MPGDVIHLDGGTNGKTYRRRLEIGGGGNNQSRVTIRRSTEDGHDGKVTIGYVSTDQPYVTIDGGHRDLFWLDISAGGYGVRIHDNADHFELRNAYVRGDTEYALPASCGHENTVPTIKIFPFDMKRRE